MPAVLGDEVLVPEVGRVGVAVLVDGPLSLRHVRVPRPGVLLLQRPPLRRQRRVHVEAVRVHALLLSPALLPRNHVWGRGPRRRKPLQKCGPKVLLCTGMSNVPVIPASSLIYLMNVSQLPTEN